MKQIAIVLLAACALSATGCDNDFKDKTAAKTEAVMDKKAGEMKAAAKGMADKAKGMAGKAMKHGGMMPLKVDMGTSSIGFVGAKVTGKHEGSFKKFKGGAKVEGDKLTGLRFSVDMASVESDDAKLTGHLKSKDFFEVEKFPKANFESKDITAMAAGGNTHKIAGELTMRGVTKAITFPAKVTIDAKSVTGMSEFTINRQDFGIKYPGMKDDLIKDDVLLKLKLVFPRN